MNTASYEKNNCIKLQGFFKTSICLYQIENGNWECVKETTNCPKSRKHVYQKYLYIYTGKILKKSLTFQKIKFGINQWSTVTMVIFLSLQINVIS